MGIFGGKKTVSESESSPPASFDDEQALALRRDWTPEEEREAKRKLDSVIMPLLTLGFFCLRKHSHRSVIW